ncbi:uncharacterized protein I303_103956 [Kwoniella dejecticola CBS 10117]|uniref:Uncharacterized protein n=1 Tax=Kwoniella dejecticola CBS 10117 TaxID=1296121 RepID=A0A1A6A876_9TREE|nr:uncharacterized protein I303_03974 [Kwoniella dejecticola CBS 10117]OBR86253.1 hypothetical protein I303_03974 [Kwoniella dejecticola CBS 10117]
MTAHERSEVPTVDADSAASLGESAQQSSLGTPQDWNRKDLFGTSKRVGTTTAQSVATGTDRTGRDDGEQPRDGGGYYRGRRGQPTERRGQSKERSINDTESHNGA